MNFKRVNHMLIPQNARDRFRWLKSGRGRLIYLPYRAFCASTNWGRFFFLFFMFAGVMGMNVWQTSGYILWAIAFAAISTSLIFRRFFKMTNVNIEVRVPAKVPVDTEFSMAVYLRNNSQRDIIAIEIAPPFLTWDGAYTEKTTHIPSLSAKSSVRKDINVKFSARGPHSLMPIIAGNVLPLGLITGRPIESDFVDFLVIPKPCKVHNLALSMRPKCQPGGVLLASVAGESSELTGVRPYRPGDRLRDIHARTWAKTGECHVKEFQQEYFTRAAVILSLDNRTNHATEEEFEASVRVAAGFLSELTNRESIVDLVTVGNGIQHITLGRHTGSLQQGLELLATVQTEEECAARVDMEKFVYQSGDKLSAAIYISSGHKTECDRLLDNYSHFDVQLLRMVISHKPVSHLHHCHHVTPKMVNSEEGIWL